MILGMPITGVMMMVGGAVIFSLVLFQVLLGLRVIKLGKRHRIVHRWVALTILGIAAVHGLFGVLYATGLRLG
jgi:cytochrome b561